MYRCLDAFHRDLIRHAAVCALMLVIVGAVARAEGATRSFTLSRDTPGGNVRTSPLPESIAPRDSLNVICGMGVACTQVRAIVDSSGLELTRTVIADNQVGFTLPDGIPPSAKVEVRLCEGALTAACLKTDAVALIRIAAAESEGTQSVETAKQVRVACDQIGASQTNELARVRGQYNFTVILFDASGVCYLNRQFGSEGDPIAIGFVSTNSASVSLDLDPCSTLAAAPKVLISGDVSALDLKAAEEPAKRVPQAQWFPPLRRCFGSAAGVKLTVDTGDGKIKALAYTIKQFERYRATLQIGIAASKLHQQTFGLRPDGAIKKIIETSAEERGPEYIASVVFYGVAHYFKRPAVTSAPIVEQVAGPTRRVVAAPGAWKTPGREAYFGRDPVNESSALDRIGLVMGTGLNQPGRRFHVGGSFELLTGVNAFLTREFVRSPELEGYAVGDEFTGEAVAIPVRDHWRYRWSAGIALDARYALALFTRK
jgi:hypothetical protein